MLGLLAGAGIAALGSYLAGKQQEKAADKNAAAYREAAEANLKAYQDAYNKSYGVGTYNQQLQDLGSQAAADYYALLNDKSAWNRYVDGVKAYQAPEEFSFTAEDLYNDPSYQFRLQQGQDALSQNQVAGGLNLSGAAAKQMNDYTQNVASTEYSNAYNRAYNQYNNDRNFDYTAWLNESKQYYNNLASQLQGLNNVNQAGVTANTNQSNALQGMANVTGNAATQNAAATAMQNNASASNAANIINSVGNILGYGVANMGTSGDNAGSYNFNPSSASAGSTISSGSGNYVDPTLFLNGYNTAFANQTGSTLL